MVNHSGELDAIFAALADPTRRQIVERLARGEASAGELGSGFSISQPAVSKHLKILEHSGLVKRKITGRVHHFRFVPRKLQSATAWIETQRRFWDASLDRLDAYLSQHSQTLQSQGKKKR